MLNFYIQHYNSTLGTCCTPSVPFSPGGILIFFPIFILPFEKFGMLLQKCFDVCTHTKIAIFQLSDPFLHPHSSQIAEQGGCILTLVLLWT